MSCPKHDTGGGPCYCDNKEDRNMFRSLGKLVGDVVEIAVAPVEVALDVTRVITKPIADVAKATAETVKEVTDDITKD